MNKKNQIIIFIVEDKEPPRSENVVYTAKRHSLFFRTGTLTQRTGEKDSIEGKACVTMTTFLEGGFKKFNKHS